MRREARLRELAAAVSAGELVVRGPGACDDIEITGTSGPGLGHLVTTSVLGTVTVASTRTRSSSRGVPVHSESGTAAFTVSGGADRGYSITLPGSAIPWVGDRRHRHTHLRRLDETEGGQDAGVGCRRHPRLAASQPAGSTSGTHALTVSYE